MRHRPKLVFSLTCALFLLARAAVAVAPEKMRAVAAEHKAALQLQTYLTADAVRQLGEDAPARKASAEAFHRLGIQTVILEVYRGAVLPSDAALTVLRDFYREQGFAVMAGMATVPGEGFGVAANTGLHWFNWQAAKTREDLEPVVRRAARLFDRIVIDDFLCTGDTSDESGEARGDRSWSAYRMDLLTGLSHSLFIGPAKEENPDVTMIVKYPQWYDRYHQFGYDVEREPQLFDEVWVGTETRGARTQRFGFTQPYEGFFAYRWMESLAGAKLQSAWFDHGDCTDIDFVEQAWQTVLAGAKQIVIFNAQEVIAGHNGHDRLREDFDGLVELAKAVALHPVSGVASYKPAHSEAGGDLYVNDFVGMLGVPLVPSAHYPDEAANLFLPAQAAHDPDIVKKIAASLVAGKNVVVTASLIASVAESETLCELAGLQGPLKSDPFRTEALVFGESRIAAQNGLDLEARPVVSTAEVLLAVYDNDTAVPFLTRHQVGSGTLSVLNSHTFSQADFDAVGEVLLSPRDLGLLYLPANWADAIRALFGGTPGVKMSAPSRVTLQPLGATGWFIQNYNDTAANIRLDFEQAGKYLIRLQGDPRTVEEQTLTLEMAPRSRVWIAKE